MRLNFLCVACFARPPHAAAAYRRQRLAKLWCMRPSYLQAAFEVICTESGGMFVHLQGMLGLNPPLQEELARKLPEQAY